MSAPEGPEKEYGALTGSFVLRHRELVRQRFGEAALAATLDSLSTAQRSQILDVTPLGWIPVSTIEAFFDALGRVVGRTAEDLHFELGPLAIEHMVRSVWRILLRLTSDESLVARVPVFYPKSWNRGRLVARMVAPGQAEARLDGWPNVPEYTVRGLRISLETTLRLAGRKDIMSSIERHPDGAMIYVRWRS